MRGSEHEKVSSVPGIADAVNFLKFYSESLVRLDGKVVEINKEVEGPALAIPCRILTVCFLTLPL